MRRLIVAVAVSIVAAVAGGGASLASAASNPILPSVTGAFGVTPKVSFPNVSPPTKTTFKVLQTGSGGKVAKGDLLVVNYVGMIWRGKTFDSSFARSTPQPVSIGVGAVIPGWDTVLVGQHVGSRIVMVLPPSAGYGATGNSQAGIKGTDTLVFVVDIISSYNKKVVGDPNAAPVRSSSNGVTVTGRDGSAPTLTIAKNAPQPTKVVTTLLDKGSGPKVRPGVVVLQIVATDWTGKVLDSTWKSGTPDGEIVGITSQPNALDSIVGYPLGSRVLVLLPKNSSGGPYALDVDIAAQSHGDPKQLK